MPDTLAQRWRAKYPGDYDDMSDQQLESAIDAKFPGDYDDMPRSQATDRKAVTPPVGGHGVTVRPDGYSVDRGIGGAEWHPNSGVKERDRPDNSFLGMPPELAAVSVAGVARGVIGAGINGASRLIGAAKGAAGAAAPIIKYEAVSHALQGVGVPAALAIPIAMTVSGYKHGAKAPRAAKGPAPTAATPASAQPVAPVASTPGVPASPVVPNAPVSQPAQAAVLPRPTTMSPQRIQNELGLAARRLKVTLTDEEYAAATKVVTETGQAPKDVVAALKQVQATAPAPVVPKAARPKMTASETKEYVRLRGKGKSDTEAAEAIAAQRQLTQSFGTPTPEQARQAVAQRNATGRWGDKR